MPRATYHDDSPAARFTEDINSQLQHRFGYKKRCAVWEKGDSKIEANLCKKMNIFLRYPPGFDKRFGATKTLVIGHLEFEEKRVGHGTWFLKLLVELAPKYGYANIGIEAARQHEGIQNFVRNFGFLELRGGDGEGPNDWISAVEDLKTRFPAEVPA